MRRKLDSTLRDVWDGIRTQPGRVGLSFMAIAIGIASLTVLIAVLGGLQDKSHQIVKELGVNVVGILQHGGAGLRERHASLLALNLPYSSVSTVRLYKVPTLGTEELLSVMATDSSLIHIRQWKMQEGRFLDHWDIQNRDRNAVVSRSLSRLWNWKVGDLIMLSSVPFKIVGVIEVGGRALDNDLADSGLVLGERVVFVPKTVIPYWVTDQKSQSPNIDAIFMRIPTSENFAHAVSTARRLLSPPNCSDSISWVTPESLIRGVKRIQNTIRLTVGSIALLCLILGGTTLMSLMVANVRDRAAEIGLRRALGASRADIALLFVLEGCLVTAVSAVAATLGMHLLLSLARDAFPVPLRLGLASISIPLIVAVMLGVVFSYWPARSAAGIMPSEALRND